MAFKMLLMVVSSCLLLDSVQAARIQESANLNQTEQDSSQLNCQDYCVYCNDGSTVWYGRSGSWFRAFINVFTDGLLLPIAGVTSMFFKATKEEYTHWTGYLPTTGLFCEKVDVIKFPHGFEYKTFTPYMLYDRNWFGKISLNELKPYTPDGTHTRKDWAKQGDYEAYKHGCKIAKAAGMKGSAAQLWSNTQELCENEVTKAVFTCSAHSRLCGAQGVHSITHASSYNKCMDQKDKKPLSTMCMPQDAAGSHWWR